MYDVDVDRRVRAALEPFGCKVDRVDVSPACIIVRLEREDSKISFEALFCLSEEFNTTNINLLNRLDQRYSDETFEPGSTTIRIGL